MVAPVTALDEALWPRAALPRRPMLGAVLDALTVRHDDRAPLSERMASPDTRAEVTDAGVTLHRPGVTNGIAWVTTNVAEAYELLQARDLVPMGYVGRFVCEACRGRGYINAPAFEGPGRERFVCGCDAGHRPHPPTVAALASWASLGFGATKDDVDDRVDVLAAEEFGREIARGALLRWRVSPPLAVTGDPRTWPAPHRALLRGGLHTIQCYDPAYVTLIVPPLGLVS